MEFERIVDSHCHWGPSLSLGIEVTTEELKSQQAQSGVTHVIIMPFPSTAIAGSAINLRVLAEAGQEERFVPYHYIREDFDGADFDPVPQGYFGGKWHWMRAGRILPRITAYWTIRTFQG